MKKGAFALKEPIHERAQGLGDRQQNQEENQNLRNTDPSHFSTSKLLWPKQGVHQVNKEGRRHNSRDGVFHEILLKTLRGLRKAPEQNEKANDDSDVENIQQHDHLSRAGCSEAGLALEST
jgi:hypothetical protein